jgi:hypothetical protein
MYQLVHEFVLHYGSSLREPSQVGHDSVSQSDVDAIVKEQLCRYAAPISMQCMTSRNCRLCCVWLTACWLLHLPLVLLLHLQNWQRL